MFKFIGNCADWGAKNAPYSLSMTALLIVAGLAFFKDCDASTTLPTLVGLFLGHAATRAVSSHWASSKDDKSDTTQVIREVEGLVDVKTTTEEKQ